MADYPCHNPCFGLFFLSLASEFEFIVLLLVDLSDVILPGIRQELRGRVVCKSNGQVDAR